MADLFDVLSGVDRPKLDAFVANSQATNGLRTAQTDEAIGTALKTQDENNARRQLLGSLKALTKDDGSPMFNDSEANFLHNATITDHGSAVNAMKALQDSQKAINTLKLSNPANLGTPIATAASQGNTDKIPEPHTVGKEFVQDPGMPAANVQETPLGAADVANQNSLAKLHNTQASNTTAAAATDPAFAGYMLYKTGRMPPMGMNDKGARQAAIQYASQLAQREANGEDITNPGFEHMFEGQQDFAAGGKALGSFASGPLGNQTRSLNNAVGHLQLMENLFQGLHNGDMQLVNSVKSKWKQAFGAEAPTDIQTAAQVIGPELTKILAGTNAGTGPERAEFGNTAAALHNSPEQTLGAIGTLKGMLGRQAADLAFQYHGATGRGDFAHRYVQPDVASYLELGPESQQQVPHQPIPSGAAPGPSASAAPVQIKGDEDYNKLPAGALFVAPDGTTRRKP